MPKTYSTRQQQAVLRCMERHEGESVTAIALMEELRRDGDTVGLATIYRQLEKLEALGCVHKIAGEDGAVYRYCRHAEAGGCVLIRCEVCGRTEHVDCTQLTSFYDHLSQHHGFSVTPRRTMLYGTCRSCQEGKA